MNANKAGPSSFEHLIHMGSTACTLRYAHVGITIIQPPFSGRAMIVFVVIFNHKIWLSKYTNLTWRETETLEPESHRALEIRSTSISSSNVS